MGSDETETRDAAGVRLLVDEPYDSRIRPVAFLLLLLLVMLLPSTLALPPVERFAVVAFEVPLFLLGLGAALFVFYGRQQLWIDGPRQRLQVRVALLGHTLRRVEIDFDDVRDLKVGHPAWLRRWLPGGGDRHPLVVVQRRGIKVPILDLHSLDAVEEVAQRLRSELEGHRP